MDDAVWTALWETLTQPKLLTRVIADYHAAVSNRSGSGDDKAAKQIEKLRRAVTHYDRIFRDPESPVDYDTRKADLANARRELLNAESLHTAAPVFQMPTAKAIEALSRQFSECANLKEFAHRRGIIERAVERILFADNKLDIHAFVEVSPLFNRKQHEHGVSNLAIRIPFVIERRVA
jgi:hypothetical protein